MFDRFQTLLEQDDYPCNSYCDRIIEINIKGGWRSHFELTPVDLNSDNVEFGASVWSLNSDTAQETGLLPGMFLVTIDDENVEFREFNVILSLLEETPKHLIFKESSKEVEEDVKYFERVRVREERKIQVGKISTSSNSTTTLNPESDRITKSILSSLTPKSDKAVTATCSSSSGKSMVEGVSCTSGDREPLVKVSLSSLAKKTLCPIHPVVDLWPILLQSDEYLTVFHERPLGIRVREDWEGKNAVVWKIEGEHAKATGVERGSIIYSINGELVYGWKHSSIIDKLKSTPLPLKIIFWRTFVIAENDEVS